MYISKVSIRNYRNFLNASFVFNKGINTIIGENGSGKTNLFRAIRLILDDNLYRYAYKLEENDFNRALGNWKGHWIIISVEFSELSSDEAIQALFVHGTGNIEGETVDKATYNLFFRPKAEFRKRLSELEENDTTGLEQILSELTIDDYETFFTGKSSVDFNDDNIYKELVGDFENVIFNFDIDESKFGIKIPNQLSVSKEISFTFIQALRDVLADFRNNRTNPLLNLLKTQSDQINEDDFTPISKQVEELNQAIEQLDDVKQIRADIKTTIKEAVGETYAPSSLSIKSNLSSEAEKLLQSLRLFIGEPQEDYEGGIHELSLGGANLIYLTLKLLEYKYRRNNDVFANFLLIEEPEAHIHTHIQKTLFNNLNFEETQIIYSTHSTHISEVSKISQMNILAKKQNYAEVYQPAYNLDEKKIIKLERYLDAVRSNLLFAKGVILVEGDAEEILIPIIIKKVYGISLDELGISLINIRSTGFKNVAQIFHNERIRRKCAIVTDLDKSIDGNESEAEKKGEKRKEILDEFTNDNEWIKAFYAEYTFEVDFLLADNSFEVIELIKNEYKRQADIDRIKDFLENDDIKISGKEILRLADKFGKGWFAIMLGNHITFQTYIPDYILDALIFSKSKFEKETIANMIKYRARKLNTLKDYDIKISDIEDIISHFNKGEINKLTFIKELKSFLEEDQIIKLLEKMD
ncbi:MAG: AAA family ATPase [Chlorobi bacterium]|nr:AAA family ATPase [Chlorobiota bacterium]